MKKHFFKAAVIIILSFFCSISFGQVKQITPPNIKSPFLSQSKKVLGNNAIITPSSPTAKTSRPSTEKLKTVNGSFMLDFKNPNNSQISRTKDSRTSKVVSNEFGAWFGLNGDHTFQLISEKEDELKITHSYYQQYYKGFLVEGSILMLHAKEGLVDAANGQVAEFASMETQIVISVDEAKNIAKSFLKVVDVINEYPVETLISKISNGNGFDFKFVHKVRIDSSNPVVMANVYIDAKNGSVFNTISLITNCVNDKSEKVYKKNPFIPINLEASKFKNTVLADTPATAITMYSGTQAIVTDSNNVAYRLRDNARNIQTFDATNATERTNSGYTGAIDFTNNSTTWGASPLLKSFTISSVSGDWWNSFFTDPLPDLYIKVKNAVNVVVYDGRDSYKNNTTLPITFSNLYIPLISQPYTVEIWDYDPIGGDDLGGSYILRTTSESWEVNGNSGTYAIFYNNPHLDAHWGAEKSHDFYLNVLNRKGFDGNGGILNQYLNIPKTVESTMPNNAFASASSSINILGYGLGDGESWNPPVSLDVVGHEFSHLVVAYRQNLFSTIYHYDNGLYYQGESGALNESFADIFGTCIEFYTKPPTTANWTIGEGVLLPFGNFLRSISNPKSKSQPNTYKGLYWNGGGVHTQSGVQNYWFYLLSEGGNGKNDLNDSYTVTGIGIDKAMRIAYKNLTTNLPSCTSTYEDSFNGSLLAAQQIFGANSQEYNSVRQAWYAVGKGSNPNNLCSGTTTLTASNGTFTDGSGITNYGDNSSCRWVIAPPGATQISLNFTAFNTEASYDIVTIFNGPDDTYPVLATYSGSALPSTVTTSAGIGAMCIKFTSDESTTNAGWTASYTSVGITPSCSGITTLANPTGNFSDGSGSSNYANNQQCFWYIAPPCATSVTLSFSQFNTELNYDGIAVYDSLEATNLIGFYSGTTLPASVTSTTGSMLVLFISDYANVSQGFTANYTSTGSSYCSGVTTLNTSDYGTITDGSGANNYCNNSNCSWLIQPPQATTVTFNFKEFELESASSDGKSIYDAVEIFDGTSASAPLLGRFTGSTIPASITSSGGSLFIRFYSDVASNFQGWSGYYTSTQNAYCNASTSKLTEETGAFSDGSGADKYSNNADCSWLIQPTNASSITLSFSAFDTELDYDGVIVYDGANNSAPRLGVFTGTTIPSPVKSTGGSMYVEFLSDEAERTNGWIANYSSTNSPSPTTFNLDRKLIDSAGDTQTSGSTIITWSLGEPIIGNMNNGNVKLTNGFHPLLNSQTLEIQDNSIDLSVIISPNPTNDFLNIHHEQNHDLKVSVFDISGKYIMQENFNFNEHKMDVRKLTKGVYIFYVQDQQSQKTNTYKIIKN